MITRLNAPMFAVLSDDELAQFVRIDAGVDPLSTSMLLGSATEIVESITGLTLRQASYRITDAVPGCLPIRPLQSVTSVSTVDDTGAPVAVTGWTVANGFLSLPTGFYGPLTVDCVAGYASAADIPDSLRHAVAVIVSAGYDNRSDMDDQTMATVMRLVAGQRSYL